MHRSIASAVLAATIVIASSAAHASAGLLIDPDDDVEVAKPVPPKPRPPTPPRSDLSSGGAGGASIVVDNPRGRLELRWIEKMVKDDSDYSVGRLGHYVFIASALSGGNIEVEAIESVTNCTGVRPRFGLTEPSPGYFRRKSYVVYYGPYVTREEAIQVRRELSACVPDAYNKEGVIKRF